MQHTISILALAITSSAHAGVRIGESVPAGSLAIQEAASMSEYSAYTDSSNSSSWLTWRAPETDSPITLSELRFTWFDPIGWCDADLRLYEYDTPTLGRYLDPSASGARLLTSEAWPIHSDGLSVGSSSQGDHISWNLPSEFTLTPGTDYALYVEQFDCYLGVTTLYGGFLVETGSNPELDVVEGQGPGPTGILAGYSSPLALSCSGGDCPAVTGAAPPASDCTPSDYTGAAAPTSGTTTTGAQWTYDPTSCATAAGADQQYETSLISSSAFGDARYRSNVYRNVSGGRLEGFDVRLDVSSSLCPITFLVHSRPSTASSSDSSAWTVEYSELSFASNTDDWHSSGSVGLDLQPGLDYSIGAAWGCDATYYYDFSDGRDWDSGEYASTLGELVQRWYGLSTPELAYSNGYGEYAHRYRFSQGGRVGINWQMSPSLTGSTATGSVVEVIASSISDSATSGGFSVAETAGWMSLDTLMTHASNGSGAFWTDNRYTATLIDSMNVDFLPEYRYLGDWYDSDTTTVDTCSDTCTWADDGVCDDGGTGSSYSVCDEGTDCTDCGTRYTSVPGESYATTLTRKPGEACFTGQWDTAPGIAHIPVEAFGLTVEPTGCTHPSADNYDGTAEADDGSCVFTCTDCVVDIPTGATSPDCTDGETLPDGSTCTWEGGTGYICTDLGTATCNDGVWSKTPTCEEASGGGDSTSCPDGQYDAGSGCVDNQCVCDNGTAAVGTACPTHNDDLCLSCDSGYTLTGGECLANTSGGGSSGSTNNGTVPALPSNGYLLLAGMFPSVGASGLRRRRRDGVDA